ncbi:MAG: hypothetical protein K6F52_02140 [Clostridia bacterium]|nr:hypothetical protein [Clostridia bacterium]
MRKKSALIRAAVLILVICVVSLCTGCGDNEKSKFKEINDAMTAFSNLEGGTLTETFVGNETTTYPSVDKVENVVDDIRSTVVYNKIGGKKYDYSEYTYSYSPDGSCVFSGLRQKDGVKYTCEDDRVQTNEELWKKIEDAGGHYSIHPSIEYMMYLPSEEFIAEDFEVTTEGDLTRYTLKMNEKFNEAIAKNNSSDATYTTQKRVMSYWIDSEGLIVKHSNEIIDRLETPGKVRERNIVKTIELTSH